MKLVIWIVFALLAVPWTAGAAIASALTQWARQALASGQAVDLAAAATQVALPAWLAVWVDPRWVQSIQLALISALDALEPWLPSVGAALGRLAPLIWLGWGLGLLVLLALAVGAHVLASRAGRRAVPRAA